MEVSETTRVRGCDWGNAVLGRGRARTRPQARRDEETAAHSNQTGVAPRPSRVSRRLENDPDIGFLFRNTRAASGLQAALNVVHVEHDGIYVLCVFARRRGGKHRYAPLGEARVGMIAKCFQIFPDLERGKLIWQGKQS